MNLHNNEAGLRVSTFGGNFELNVLKIFFNIANGLLFYA